MANSLITPTIIAKEALMQLENNLVMARMVHREYQAEFKGGQGATVNIRKPVKFTATDGATLSEQDVTESYTSITVDQRKHVAWAFTTQDETLTIEEYSKRYIAPAAAELAQQIETSLTGLYSSVWQHVGTPGTVPSTFLELGAARQRLVEAAAPMTEEINACLDPAAALKVANDLKLVNLNNGKVLTALERVRVGKYAGLENYENQSLRVHTVGALGGTPLVNGAGQVTTVSTTTLSANTQTLNIDGASNSITGWAKAGDVFTIANVFSVNPKTRQSTGRLQEFVVTADANSTGGGAVALTISPCIITSGAFQTVNAAPADNAAITWKVGTAATGYVQNLCFQRNAFALVTVPLDEPRGGVDASRMTHNNISIRVARQYAIASDKNQIRLDILYGVKAIYPELAVRLTN